MTTISASTLRQPVMFISHGAPTLAIESGLTGRHLNRIGRLLPTPSTILIVSPHWITPGRSIQVGASAQPATIHDFSGFPPALYQLTYPAQGLPSLARTIAAQLTGAGYDATVDTQQGLDHGAWVPLMHLYPQADIPIVQMSLPENMTPQELILLGRELSALRTQGIMIVATGSITHNLGDMRFAGRGPLPYVQPFADWIAAQIAVGDEDALCHYRQRAPEAVRAHPHDDHLMPLFIALGAAGADIGAAQRIESGITYDILSMDSYLFGSPALAGLS
jgi:4,5-DOPA dioxygenase extradiol